MEDNIIVIKDLKKVYNPGRHNEVIALRGVNLVIARGSSIAIMGVSGSGKSTLLNIIGCLDTPTEGEYCLNGKSLCTMTSNDLADIRNSNIGFILQDNALLGNESAISNVKLPLCFSKNVKIKDYKVKAINALQQSGIANLFKRKVRELSGGQRQRVAIARSIVNNPDIILADEPTSALDSATAKDIMDLFKKLQLEGKTIVIVTHDKAVAERMDRTVFIKDGIIEEA